MEFLLPGKYHIWRNSRSPETRQAPTPADRQHFAHRALSLFPRVYSLLSRSLLFHCSCLLPPPTPPFHNLFSFLFIHFSPSCWYSTPSKKEDLHCWLLGCSKTHYLSLNLCAEVQQAWDLNADKDLWQDNIITLSHFPLIFIYSLHKQSCFTKPLCCIKLSFI